METQPSYLKNACKNLLGELKEEYNRYRKLLSTLEIHSNMKLIILADFAGKVLFI